MALPRAMVLEDLYESIEEENNTHVEYVDYWTEPGSALVQEYIAKYGVFDKCADECKVCQITHIEKYKVKYPDHVQTSFDKAKVRLAETGELAFTHAFQIVCPYIPKHYDELVDPGLRNTLSPEELHRIRIVQDPTEFAKHYFSWYPYKHQETMLRCQSKYKVLRWGRRIGKSESLAIEILWHAFTKSRRSVDPATGRVIEDGLKVLIVAPFESQVINIFEMLMKFINRSPEAKACLKNFRKSPYHNLELTNGATIKGFTTGANDAESLRGQDANILILDEADYLGAGDYKVILALMHSHEDVLVRACSTPSGARERFFSWCTDDPKWKEFYFPSPVIEKTPYELSKKNWKQMRMEARPEHSLDNWLQEMMAIFITSAQGVYQAGQVSKAMEDYTYKGMNEAKLSGELLGWRFSVGVDWNSNVGTEICILGIAPGLGFRVMDMVNVPKQDFTQYKGLQRLVDLFQMWKPEYVYMDAGYGSTNIEMLRLWSSQQAPGSYERSLEKRLKKYEFGGKVDLRDPVSHVLIKHPAKAYMVENSVRKFEDSVIKFSVHDDKLRKQLLNYIIQSRSEAGKPIYGFENKNIGDHALDALNLALVAFALEESPMSPEVKNPSTQVGVLGGNQHMLAVGRHGSPDRPALFDPTSRQALAAVVEERSAAMSKRNDKITNGDDPVFPMYRQGFHNDTERQELANYKRDHQKSNNIASIKRRIGSSGSRVRGL